MRLLHTSDWHLGGRLIGESREEEHREFLAWLVESIKSREIDALIIAGDIFDTATPPSYAREILNDFFADILESNCRDIVVIGGNHDSSLVLNEQRNLLKALNIHIIGGYTPEIKDLTIEVKRDDGSLKGVISAIPFLKESDLRDSQKSTEIESRAVELEREIALYYKRAFEYSLQLSKSRVPTVATGHLSTLKIENIDSVREIYIGSLEIFNKALFPPFDYIALGHYHRFRQMKNICYSGSPFPLSFSEAGDKKVVLKVEVEVEEPPKIEKIEIPNFRKLHRVSGDLREIEESLRVIEPESKILPEFVEIDIQKKDSLINLTNEIERLKEINSNLKIIKSRLVHFDSEEGLNTLELKHQRLEEMTPLSVFEKKLELESFEESEKRELITLFKRLCEEMDIENS